jgi:hypothetical protein
MNIVYTGQIVIPVALAAWLLLRPQRSTVGYATQLIASMLAMIALRHIGIWLVTPWWIPHAAAAIMLLGAVRPMFRSQFATIVPNGALAWTGVGFFALLGMVSLAVTFDARKGWIPPQTPTPIELAFPLAGGRYMVVNGGNAASVNAHIHALSPRIAQLQPYRGSAWAVDIVAVDVIGMRADGFLPRDPSKYWMFGAAVLAPCQGRIVRLVDDLEDMPVGEFDNDHPAGNHIILQCAEAHIVLAHLQQWHALVKTGDAVELGKVLGTVGNSGNSNEPHLHIHAQKPGPPDAPLSGDPLPMRIAGRYLVRGDIVVVPVPRP